MILIVAHDILILIISLLLVKLEIQLDNFLLYKATNNHCYWRNEDSFEGSISKNFIQLELRRKKKEIQEKLDSNFEEDKLSCKPLEMIRSLFQFNYRLTAFIRTAFYN